MRKTLHSVDDNANATYATSYAALRCYDMGGKEIIQSEEI